MLCFGRFKLSCFLYGLHYIIGFFKMFSFKKKEKKRVEDANEAHKRKLTNTPYLFCPYCDGKIDDNTGLAELYIEMPPLVDGECEQQMTILGCPHCKKVLSSESNIWEGD